MLYEHICKYVQIPGTFYAPTTYNSESMSVFIYAIIIMWVELHFVPFSLIKTTHKTTCYDNHETKSTCVWPHKKSFKL